MDETINGSTPEVPGQYVKRVRACETCRRRKEKCDGLSPCARCVQRGASLQCRHQSSPSSLRLKRRRRDSEHNPSDAAIPSDLSGAGLGDAILLQDQQGRYMFVGDSSELSFLQTIRRFVQDFHGSCDFVEDQNQHMMLEGSPGKSLCQQNASVTLMPPDLTLDDAKSYVKAYIMATNCILDLFDEEDLLNELPKVFRTAPVDTAIPGPVLYLVLAIGAQTSPSGEDHVAQALYEYGRLMVQNFMEDTSLWTVRSYALIAMYMLNACRRNTAFIYLGTAIRAAYALGLHLREVASIFSRDELRARERLWKVIRILDLFLSVSLGRPSATAETREIQAAKDEDYSASTDLCVIFERILIDVYDKRMVSTEALSSIGMLHRKWASRFLRGLAVDRIELGDFLPGSMSPNISVLHLIEAYYWTIILLTRPFLTEGIVAYAEASQASPTNKKRIEEAAASLQSLPICACVHSAVKIIELLKVLLGCEGVPKRLPLVVNCLFSAALVLGLAHFGDLDHTFQLDRYLGIACSLLDQFKHDSLAQQYARTIEQLMVVCRLHVERRFAKQLARYDFAVASLFGQVHHVRSQRLSRAQSPERSCDLAGSRQQDDGSTRHACSDGDSAPLDVAALGEATGSLEGWNEADANVGDIELWMPSLSPRTLWFDSFSEDSHFFSTA